MRQTKVVQPPLPFPGEIQISASVQERIKPMLGQLLREIVEAERNGKEHVHEREAKTSSSR